MQHSLDMLVLEMELAQGQLVALLDALRRKNRGRNSVQGKRCLSKIQKFIYNRNLNRDNAFIIVTLFHSFGEGPTFKVDAYRKLSSHSFVNMSGKT